jgi:hypothetical protein
MRFTRSTLTKIVFPTCISFASPVLADPIPIHDYLETMDRTEVSFSGRIKYNSSEDSFKFYNESRDPFGVTIDAGRDAREQIETECDNPSFMVSYSDLCTILGSGTVEIRGSRIYISIETVDQLSK